MHGSKQLHAIRCFKTFNQSGYPLQEPVFFTLAAKELFSGLCRSRKKRNFHIRFLAITVSPYEMSLQQFQDLVQITSVRTVVALFVLESKRLSGFLEEISQFLDFQQGQIVIKTLIDRTFPPKTVPEVIRGSKPLE